MADDALASRTDLEALQRAGSGKVLALGALLLAALGGAGWYYFGQTEGIGGAEDPAKVLIVRPDDAFVGFSSILKDGGFDAAEGTLDHWAARAKTEIPDLEVDGIEAVMTLADNFGYGFVVFQSPADVDFSALDVAELPDFSGAAGDDVAFAAVSVGDFAFPHRVTVNPPPAKAMHSVELDLLGALFAQERLAIALPERSDGGMEVVQLRDQLADALDELAQVANAVKLAEKVRGEAIRALVESERADPAPTLIGEPLEHMLSVAVSGGQVLSLGRQFSVVSENGLTPQLEADGDQAFLLGAPGEAPSSRNGCSDPRTAWQRGTEYVLSRAGDALLVAPPGGDLFLMGGMADGCAPRPLAGLTREMFDDLGTTTFDRAGRLAWSSGTGDPGVLRIRMPDAKVAVDIGPVAEAELGQPMWLGPKHLVSVGRDDDANSGLYLFSLDEPERALQIDSSVLASPDSREFGGPELHQLAMIGDRTDAVLVTAGDPRQLFRIDFPAPVATLFATPPLAVAPRPSEEAAPGDAGVVPQDPEVAEADFAAEAVRGRPSESLDVAKFTTTTLTREGDVLDPVSSPDGTLVAFELFDQDAVDDRHGSEIATVDVKGGKVVLRTTNDLADSNPGFTRDGRFILMTTMLQIPKARHALTVTRIVPSGQAPPTP